MRLLVTGGLPFASGIVGLGGEIAWPRPTRPGDTLHVESEIVETTPSRSKPYQGIVTVRGTMFNQNQEAVYVLTAKLLVPKSARQNSMQPIQFSTRIRCGRQAIAVSSTLRYLGFVDHAQSERILLVFCWKARARIFDEARRRSGVISGCSSHSAGDNLRTVNEAFPLKSISGRHLLRRANSDGGPVRVPA